MERKCSLAHVTAVVIICFQLTFTCHGEGIPTLVSASEVEVNAAVGDLLTLTCNFSVSIRDAWEGYSVFWRLI